MNLNISYSELNTHVENSYLLTTRQAIKEKVEEIIDYRNITKRPVSRSIGSYVREWKAHNKLYEKHYKIDHTKDVDLEERITTWQKIKGIFMDLIWLIIGGI